MNKDKEAYRQILETEKLANEGLDQLMGKIKNSDKLFQKMMEEAKPEDKGEMTRLFAKSKKLQNLAKKGDIQGLHNFHKQIMNNGR